MSKFKGRPRTPHGLSGTPTYKSWICAKRRAQGKSDNAHRYNGRGIYMCESWLISFENFFNDMGFRPDGCTLDRIDNNLGYYPENCRWATPKEQSQNLSTNKEYTLKGETKCASEWARELGVSPQVLWRRLNVLKWDTEKALTTPNKRKKNAH